MLGASIAPRFLGMVIASDTLKVLGWQNSAVVPIGFVELSCVFLYLWPCTSVLGAVFAAALLGGAVANPVAGRRTFVHSLDVRRLPWRGDVGRVEVNDGEVRIMGSKSD